MIGTDWRNFRVRKMCAMSLK